MTMRIRCLCLTFLGLLLATSAVAAQPDTIVFDPGVMAETKERILRRDPALMPAYQRLMEEADRALTAPAETVVLKPAPPPGGSFHDYWSLAPHWWPDPDRPGGLPYVRREDRRNPEADTAKYDRRRMARMARAALTLSLAWFLTENEEYAGKATALIWAWCCDNVTRMTPRLDYARSRPGSRAGSHTGIIETRDLIWVCEAARILEPSKAWSAVVTRKTQDWFRDYSRWLLNSPFGQAESETLNNHATWYDAQLAVFALYSGDKSLARSIVGAADRRRIGVQIAPNGAMPKEFPRSRSRHHAFFNLQAFFILAAVAERLGIDLWNWHDPHTGSIKRAFDYAAPYVAKTETWPFGPAGKYDPFLFTRLFHRAALVYKGPRYLELLDALPQDKLEVDRARLFH